MNSLRMSSVIAVVALALICVGCSREDEKKPATPPAPKSHAKGSLAVTVTNEDGTPAADVSLRLIREVPIGMGSGGGGGEQLIKSVVTDKDGKFEIKDLKPQAYRLIGGNDGIGWIYSDLEVLPGEQAKLDAKL